ncbi:MAG TPA: hypothetical protein VNA67_00165 [Pseudonocardiaceae bacterium]|nr:hypothetical protein [Pseudonocardiaceae bacterium]
MAAPALQPVRRIAVGVTVCDPVDPAVTGFDMVLARDTPNGQGRQDLSTTGAQLSRCRSSA